MKSYLDQRLEVASANCKSMFSSFASEKGVFKYSNEMNKLDRKALGLENV